MHNLFAGSSKGDGVGRRLCESVDGCPPVGRRVPRVFDFAGTSGCNYDSTGEFLLCVSARYAIFPLRSGVRWRTRSTLAEGEGKGAREQEESSILKSLRGPCVFVLVGETCLCYATIWGRRRLFSFLLVFYRCVSAMLGHLVPV